MKIKINGRTLLAKNLDTARLRDVAELQRQTGWRLEDIRKESSIETVGAGVVLFLTLHNAGFTPSWDEVMDGAMDDFQIVSERGDVARAEGGDASDPAPSPEDSAPAAAHRGAAGRNTRSSTPSRGSKTKSAAD